MTFTKTRVFLKRKDFLDLDPYRNGLTVTVGAPDGFAAIFLRRGDVEALYEHLGRFLDSPKTTSSTLGPISAIVHGFGDPEGTRISTTLSPDDRWQSSNPGVATVDQQGRVTNHKAGEVSP